VLLKSGGVVVLLIIGSIFWGDLVLRFYTNGNKPKFHLGYKLAYGFIFFLASFQIAAFPFLILKDCFSVLYTIYTLIFIILCIVEIRYFICHKSYFLKFKLKKLHKINTLMIVLLIIATIQILITSWGSFACADDGYYIGISNEAIEHNTLFLNDAVVYSGNHLFENSCTRPGINSWEIFIAWISKLLCLHPAIIMHTVLPLFLIPVFYLVAWITFFKLTNKKNFATICTIIYSVLLMFWGNGFFISSYAMFGTWMGKAILYHIVLPLIVCEMVDIYNCKQDKQSKIKLNAITVAGVAATAIGVYTVPIYLFSLAVPMLFKLVVKKAFKCLVKLIVHFIMSVWLIIIYAVYAVAYMVYYGNEWSNNYSDFNLKNIYINAFQYNFVIVILLICSIFCLLFIEKNKRLQLMFIGQLVIIGGVLLNPLCAHFIAFKITGVPVYWRLVLLLPTNIMIPMLVVWVDKLCSRMPRKLLYQKGSALVLCLIISVSSSQSLFNMYQKHWNVYMIPSNVLEISMQLKQDNKVCVLADQSINKFFRQYSAEFDVIVGRNDQITQNKISEEYFKLYNQVFQDKEINDAVIQQLKAFKINYLIVDYPIEKIGHMKLYLHIDQYYVYKLQ